MLPLKNSFKSVTIEKLLNLISWATGSDNWVRLVWEAFEKVGSHLLGDDGRFFQEFALMLREKFRLLHLTGYNIISIPVVHLPRLRSYRGICKKSDFQVNILQSGWPLT
jgi:hypothetical protein